MGTLWYWANCSVDGYRADAEGRFDFTEPTEEVLRFINERQGEVSTYVFGRRMYEVMKVWDTMPRGESPGVDEFARLWDGIDKIVCSDTLTGVETKRTTLEPRLTVERLREIVAEADGVVAVDGPTTAAPALRAALVDELHLLVTPHVVGGGLRALPEGARFPLSLVEVRRFGDGSVYLRYGRP